MSLLIALLIFVGPFVAVAPVAALAAVQSRPWRPRRIAWRMPSVQIRLEMAW